MKSNELTGAILLSNSFKEAENDVYEYFLQVTEHFDTGDTDVYYRRLYMYYNYLEWRWSVWYLSGDGKQHLGYCQTVEQLNKILQKNNIDKEIIIKKEDWIWVAEYIFVLGLFVFQQVLLQ